MLVIVLMATLALPTMCPDSGRVVAAWSDIVDIQDYGRIERRANTRADRIRIKLNRKYVLGATEWRATC